ncbi:MAG: Hpt domain-containing response regulator [Hyphomicrobiales bacterium]
MNQVAPQIESADPLEDQQLSGGNRNLRFPPNVKPLVLVVDDNLTYRLVLCALLQQMGAETMQAVSGDDAITKAGKHQFDVILMDIGLPDMDGFQAATRIQTASAEAVPIIACTAYDGFEEREAASNACLHGFITKPAGRRNVFMAILECMSSKKTSVKQTDFTPADGPEKEQGEPVLDRGSLEAMLGDLDPDIQSLILASVPHDTNAALAMISAGALDGNLNKLEVASHQLKGLARTFGARRLAVIVDELHKLAREGVRDEALACIPAVQSGAREMLDALAEKPTA